MGSAVVAPRRPGHAPLTAFAPPYAGAKGAWIPACAGMTGVVRGMTEGACVLLASGDVAVCGGCPAAPRACPCVLASLVRVPFRWGERGQVAAGFRRCGGLRWLPRSAPGIPRSLRSRPLTLARRGLGAPRPPRHGGAGALALSHRGRGDCCWGTIWVRLSDAQV